MDVAWVSLLGLTLALWAACGAVMVLGRRLGSLDLALRVHLIAAPILAFIVSSVHARLAPDFDPLVRAVAMTALVIVLDAAVVAPLFERSYAMFRSLIGTWIPFAAIFVASWAAGAMISVWIP